MARREERADVAIRFDVHADDNSVDASAAGSTLNGLASLVQELHREYEKDSQLLVKARPFKKGSLEIPLEIIVVMTPGALFTSDILDALLGGLKEFFHVKTLLEGIPGKFEGNKIIIRGAEIQVSDSVLQVLHPANKANALFAEATKNLEEDDTISGVEILANRERVAQIRRPQFKFYRLRTALEETTRTEEESGREVVSIIGPMFTEGVKWAFLRKGKPIHAEIADNVFMNRVIARGEAFANGDKLDCELVATREYDVIRGSYARTTYRVVRVFRHIKEPPLLFD